MQRRIDEIADRGQFHIFYLFPFSFTPGPLRYFGGLIYPYFVKSLICNQRVHNLALNI